MGRKSEYTEEFKAEAVKLTQEPGYTIVKVAKQLGIAQSTLWDWVQEVESSETLSRSEQAELKRLRKEVRDLKMERDILKKAAAYFAKESG